ncbi:MAG: hypothetical protein J5518_09660 [Lachnospiraceae bacterium]|nr:hypothetical protein [Lachnospiraceae bacterium]
MKKVVPLLLGALVLLQFCGCGGEKYKLNFDGYGFESAKKSYAPGDEVTVYFTAIGTDRDYRFTCDEDVKMKQDFDMAKGYILQFTMPDHDVTVHVNVSGGMMMDPDAHVNP